MHRTQKREEVYRANHTMSLVKRSADWPLPSDLLFLTSLPSDETTITGASMLQARRGPHDQRPGHNMIRLIFFIDHPRSCSHGVSTLKEAPRLRLANHNTSVAHAAPIIVMYGSAQLLFKSHIIHNWAIPADDQRAGTNKNSCRTCDRPVTSLAHFQGPFQLELI